MKRAIIGAGVVALAGLAGACSGNPFTQPKPLVATPSACGTQKFDVYFADSQAGLTPAARQAISLTATALQTCEIRSVRVTGLADARGRLVPLIADNARCMTVGTFPAMP